MREPAIAATCMRGPQNLVRCVVKHARFGPSGKDDSIGKPRKIHRQTSCDSVVLTEDTGAIRGLPIDGDQRNLARPM